MLHRSIYLWYEYEQRCCKHMPTAWATAAHHHRPRSHFFLSLFFEQLDAGFFSSSVWSCWYLSPERSFFINSWANMVWRVRLDGAIFECSQLSYWPWLLYTHNRIQIVVSLWTYIIMCLSIISIIITFSRIYSIFSFVLSNCRVDHFFFLAYLTFYFSLHFRFGLVAYRFGVNGAFFLSLST